MSSPPRKKINMSKDANIIELSKCVVGTFSKHNPQIEIPTTMTQSEERQFLENIARAYCLLLDEHRDLLPQYLDQDAVLDWFGRPIAGKDNIEGYFRYNIHNSVHSFTSIQPSGPTQSRRRVVHDSTPLSSTSYMSPLEIRSEDLVSTLDFNSLSFNEGNTLEPVFTTPTMTAKLENGQGDGPAILKPSPALHASRFFEARGTIKFSFKPELKRATLKNAKALSGTKDWERTCKVHISYRITDQDTDYSCPELGAFKICQMIYQDNNKIPAMAKKGVYRVNLTVHYVTGLLSVVAALVMACNLWLVPLLCVCALPRR
uniref:Uncharacterized protein n=1 Tax=Timema genevievae TaxID=629358 RepID=A0A7R9JZE7_TIMGE|nr:unnamed protein product [Timema genevievae]